MRSVHKLMRHLGFIWLTVLLAACTAANQWRSEPVRVESDYGDAVRQMVSAQRIQLAVDPGDFAPDGINAERAAVVFETYRGYTSKPQSVERPITFNITTGRR